MGILEEGKEPKLYTFSWEVKGYDCAPSKIRSQKFTVNLEITDWQLELDLSKLKNIDSSMTVRLQRDPRVGPNAVTFVVDVTVKLSEYKGFEKSCKFPVKTFGQQQTNYVDFCFDIPTQKLESKEDDFNWLTSKSLTVDVNFKIPEKPIPDIPKRVWYNDKSLEVLKEDLKELFSSGYSSNLILKVKDKEFKLHKYILNARWPKLMSKLEVNKSPKEVETKEFTGIPYVVLKDMLEFAYCGDLNFMYNLDITTESVDIFRLAREYNFYRLNDRISQLPSNCSSSQVFQSYRTSVEMKFENVTSTETAMGDFRTCEIPLKPRRYPISDKAMNDVEREKFQRHIRFMDIRLYVKKGQLGYNWLMFSVVLGCLPKNPVTIKSKLYVVGEGNVKYLLTEQNLVFDDSTLQSFTTPLSKPKEKVHKRYLKTSEPVIMWRELIDDRKGFMRKRLVRNTPQDKGTEEKDIYFRLEFKLADGEYLHDSRNGECEFELDWDQKICQDLKSMFDGKDMTDIEVYSVYSRGVGIPVHKAILAARSSVLRKALDSNPESLTINIQSEYLRVFIQYLYTGQVPEVPDDKIGHLLSVADEYKMECLRHVLAQPGNIANGRSSPASKIIYQCEAV